MFWYIKPINYQNIAHIFVILSFYEINPKLSNTHNSHIFTYFLLHLKFIFETIEGGINK